MPQEKNGRTEGWKDGQTLFYRTLPATARGSTRKSVQQVPTEHTYMRFLSTVCLTRNALCFAYNLHISRDEK